MTPKLTRTLADALEAQGVDDPVKVARALMETMKGDPEVVVKWLVAKGALNRIGFVINEDKPGRISPIPMTRQSVPVYTVGGE